MLAGSGNLQIPEANIVMFYSHFDTLCELRGWMHTSLPGLFLKVECSGNYQSRVKRHLSSIDETIHDESIEGSALSRVEVAWGTSSWRLDGALYSKPFALTNIVICDANWITRNAHYQLARLAAAFCIFNRQADIGRVLTAIWQDDAVLAHLERIYVVNEGEPGLAGHSSIAPLLPKMCDQLCIVDPGNFCGAGDLSAGIPHAQNDSRMIDGWQIYYEARNILIALHSDVRGVVAARRVFRYVMLHLLGFRYYGAALIVKCMEASLGISWHC